MDHPQYQPGSIEHKIDDLAKALGIPSKDLASTIAVGSQKTISLVDQELLFPLSAQLYPRTHVHMTWATQEGAERGSTCLVSEFNSFNCSLILEDESNYFSLISGELFIAVNFTVAQPKNDRSFQKFLPGNARPSMIKIRLGTYPWSGNAFPMFTFEQPSL